MKIVVIGGSGLIGTKLVTKLRQLGHEVVAASPASGVNTITGEGLAEALAAAQVVADVANSPSFEDAAVLKFFETSGRNLRAAEAAAGVRHHVALSVVGTDRLPECGYFRAKMAQEDLITASKVPYSILRSTQFFEFLSSIAHSGTDGQTVRLSPAFVQPVVSDDVAAALADIAIGAPVNGTVELAGPERLRLDELVRRFLSANQDPRQVITDVHARYFGAELNDQSLTPGDNPRIAPTRFEDWLSHSLPQRSVGQAGSTPRSTRPLNTERSLPMPNNEPAPSRAEQQPRSTAWQTALTTLQEAKPPFFPDGAEVMTVLIEFPPGDPGTPPHRHPGPAFGYMPEGEMLFELEGEPERVIRAGEAFWEPGGDVIHYQDGNNRKDTRSRFVVTMMCVPGKSMLSLVDDEELAQRKDRRAIRPS